MELNQTVAEELYARGCEAEAEDQCERAAQLYQRALECDVFHADAHVNLGRILQSGGELEQAELHYRFALFVQPEDAVASFNLATLLEDRGLLDEAVLQYRAALELDPSCEDAHFNLSRLYEQQGELLLAFRHLKEYRQLYLGERRAGYAVA